MTDIIWTRSLGDWDDDQKLFGADCRRVLRLPCIRIVARDLTSDDGPEQEQTLAKKNPATHVVFTSTHAARLALRLPRLVAATKRATAVYTHGKITADVLRAAGIKTQLVAARDGKALGMFLAEELSKPPSHNECSVLWPCGEAVAFDFSADLLAAGIPVQRVILYDTLQEVTDAQGHPLAAANRHALIQNQHGVVCFASPSAARCFVETFRPQENRLGRDLRALVIGPTTAEAVRGHFQHIQITDESTNAALAAAALAGGIPSS